MMIRNARLVERMGQVKRKKTEINAQFGQRKLDWGYWNFQFESKF